MISSSVIRRRRAGLLRLTAAAARLAWVSLIQLATSTGSAPALSVAWNLADRELENAKPAVAADLGAVVKITELAWSLERKTDSIRNCIEQGIIPRAGSAGRQRARLARRGGQRDHRRRPRRAHPVETASAISETNFSLLAWEARTAQQMWATEKRKPSTISG